MTSGILLIFQRNNKNKWIVVVSRHLALKHHHQVVLTTPSCRPHNHHIVFTTELSLVRERYPGREFRRKKLEWARSEEQIEVVERELMMYVTFFYIVKYHLLICILNQVSKFKAKKKEPNLFFRLFFFFLL